MMATPSLFTHQLPIVAQIARRCDRYPQYLKRGFSEEIDIDSEPSNHLRIPLECSIVIAARRREAARYAGSKVYKDAAIRTAYSGGSTAGPRAKDISCSTRCTIGHHHLPRIILSGLFRTESSYCTYHFSRLPPQMNPRQLNEPCKSPGPEGGTGTSPCSSARRRPSPLLAARGTWGTWGSRRLRRPRCSWRTWCFWGSWSTRRSRGPRRPWGSRHAGHARSLGNFSPTLRTYRIRRFDRSPTLGAFFLKIDGCWSETHVGDPFSLTGVPWNTVPERPPSQCQPDPTHASAHKGSLPFREQQAELDVPKRDPLPHTVAPPTPSTHPLESLKYRQCCNTSGMTCSFNLVFRPLSDHSATSPDQGGSEKDRTVRPCPRERPEKAGRHVPAGLIRLT